MTIMKVNFDDDYYQMALNSLKASGNYQITFKTYANARSARFAARIARNINPNLQFSTFMQSNSDTPTYLINQGTSSTVATPSFSELQANLRTNIIAFNQY
jgi:hypothetical protein